MKRMRKRITAFILTLVMLFTTGCVSGFYADELSPIDKSVSGNSREAEMEGTYLDDSTELEEPEEFIINSDEISEPQPEEMETDTVSSNDITAGDSQYHFIKDDADSLFHWLDLYMPNLVYEDLTSLPQEWFDNLYDYEREVVESFADPYTIELDENLYHDQGIDECIRILESEVVDSMYFFQKTWLQYMTLKDLYLIKELGYDTEDIESIVAGYVCGEDNYIYRNYVNQSDDNLVEFGDLVTGLIDIVKDETNQPKRGMRKAARAGGLDPDSGPLSPTFGQKWPGGPLHDHITQIYLTNGETKAPCLCYKEGAYVKSSYKYYLAMEVNGTMGYFASKANVSGESHAQVQVAAWVYQKYYDKFRDNRAGFIAQAMSRFSYGGKEYARSMSQDAWKFYHEACGYMGSNAYKAYVYFAEGSSNYQPLVTTKKLPPPEDDPEITTKALTANGLNFIDKTLDPTLSTVTINDTISYLDFKEYIGKTCTLKGWVVINSESNIAPGTVQEMPVTITQKSGTWNMSFTVDISSLNNGDKLVVCEELYDDKGRLICDHKKLSNAKQTITLGSTPVDIPPETGDITEQYDCSATMVTTVEVTKKDIETSKPLQGVTFQFSDGFNYTGVTDDNGNCSETNSDILEASATWSVSTSDETHTKSDGQGGYTQDTTYKFTCSQCGTQEFSSSGERDSAGHAHCLQHATQLAEADLDAQVAAYTFSWTVTETAPRTSNHSSALVTGGSGSYTTGYHNNPVITKSNTETGYQKGGLTGASTPNYGKHAGTVRNVPVPLTNERVRGTITINKSDMDYLNCRTEGDNNQDFIPQGDASLAGAVYGLYANADIIRPDGKSGDRTGLPTNIRMDYCTGSVDDPSAHKTYAGKNPFGIDAIHTTTPLDVPVHQVSYNYSDNCVYHKGDLVAVGMFDRI